MTFKIWQFSSMHRAEDAEHLIAIGTSKMVLMF